MTVNIARIDKVIEMIKKQDVARFDITGYFQLDVSHPCGTAACIGGFALIAKHNGNIEAAMNSEHEYRFYCDMAAEYLGFDFKLMEMFYGFEMDVSGLVPMEHITADDAINVLQQVKDTGKFSWKFHPKFKSTVG